MDQIECIGLMELQLRQDVKNLQMTMKIRSATSGFYRFCSEVYS